MIYYCYYCYYCWCCYYYYYHYYYCCCYYLALFTFLLLRYDKNLSYIILNNVRNKNLGSHKSSYMSQKNLMSEKTNWRYPDKCFVAIRTSRCCTKKYFMSTKPGCYCTKRYLLPKKVTDFFYNCAPCDMQRNTYISIISIDLLKQLKRTFVKIVVAGKEVDCINTSTYP